MRIDMVNGGERPKRIAFALKLVNLYTGVYPAPPFTATYLPRFWHRDVVGYFMRSMHGSGGWEQTTARRYECFGTRDWAVTACIGDAIDFQKAVGPERIDKRGRQLMDYFKREVQEIKDVKLHTSLDPRMSC